MGMVHLTRYVSEGEGGHNGHFSFVSDSGDFVFDLEVVILFLIWKGQ